MTAQALTTFEVDLNNPGQFLACCGLLELAGRMDAEAVAWFDGPTFCVRNHAGDLLGKFLEAEITPCGSAKTPLQKPNGKLEESPPVKIGKPFDLLLDWWEDDAATRAGFKTWSGGQTVIGFIKGMRSHMESCIKETESLFAAKAIDKPKPFYFDSRISRLTSLDLGFSAEKFTSAFSPAVELLALVGLQRFRPGTVIERERYAYAAWKEPLPPAIAAAAAAGMIPTLADRRYQFPLVVRTGDKYKAFGPATLERNSHG